MQLSATVKKPPFSSRTPPVQSNTMPAFSRHPASLPLSAPVPAAFGSPEDRFSSVVSHRRGVSGGSAVRRRLRCSRMLIHPRTLIVASMFSLFLVAYWTSYLSTASFSLDGILKKKQRDKEQSRQTEIDIHQVLEKARDTNRRKTICNAQNCLPYVMSIESQSLIEIVASAACSSLYKSTARSSTTSPPYEFNLFRRWT
jgi:hypothetical protein